MININGVKIEVNTSSGLFGAEYLFNLGFNIIRGNNTSGKSSLFQAILYGLGFEELIGGRNNKTMQSVLKDSVEYPKGEFQDVLQSVVYLELQNQKNEIVTIRRSVINPSKASQLIEVHRGGLITNPTPEMDFQPMYVHDAGGATDVEFGFHSFLESFIGWELPKVLDKSGNPKRLYIQQTAPAYILEQKTGWSDFFATVPYYGLSNIEARVVEFILKLDVYQNKQKKHLVATNKKLIENSWQALYKQFSRLGKKVGGRVFGLNPEPIIINDINEITIKIPFDDPKHSISESIMLLNDEINEIRSRLIPKVSQKIQINEEELDEINNKISEYLLKHEMLFEEVSFDKESLKNYQGLLESLQEDLSKNKGALKVQRLGAESEIKTLLNQCPTCEQAVSDSLLPQGIQQTPMNIEENISYIESQINMIKVYIDSHKISIQDKEYHINQFKAHLANLRGKARAIQKELISDDRLPSEVEINRRIELESKVHELFENQNELNCLLAELAELSSSYEKVLADEKSLPNNFFSSNDELKLNYLLEQFKRLLAKFSYSSKSDSYIGLSPDNYLPVVQKRINEFDVRSYDLRFDSSASDFIRCMWAYTCGLLLTSENFRGNHPKLLIFDEPKQQDISIQHFRSFLTELSEYKNAQVLVFASFENSDEAFNSTTADLQFHLNYIDGRLIRPLQTPQ